MLPSLSRTNFFFGNPRAKDLSFIDLNRHSSFSRSHDFFQVRAAIQQTGFLRVKRGLKSPLSSLIRPISHIDELEAEKNIPTDPYFPLQWYLRNTGQNGGKIHLDLNVQDAWNQGITGKNVTTAIMDDGNISYLKLD